MAMFLISDMFIFFEGAKVVNLIAESNLSY
jgi:hypothetical protein